MPNKLLASQRTLLLHISSPCSSQAEIVATALRDQPKGWVLDGWPSSPAGWAALSSAGITPDRVFVLRMTAGYMYNLVQHRHVDPITGRVYHTEESPPSSEAVAARLRKVANDQEAAVESRVQAFESLVAALGDLEGKRVDLVGNSSDDEVWQALRASLEGRLSKEESLWQVHEVLKQAEQETHLTHQVKQYVASRRFITVLAPAGTGKSQLCERLAKEYDLKHLKLSTLIPAVLTLRTPLARKVRFFVEKGLPLPPKLLLRILQACVRHVLARIRSYHMQ